MSGVPERSDDAMGEVIIEFVRNGAYLKCSAIHSATGTEVSAIGPVNEKARLERIAVGKLRRALVKAGPQDVVGRGWKA